MSESRFTRLLIAVIAACLLATAVHAGYIVYAYQHASIIRFIAGEVW